MPSNYKYEDVFTSSREYANRFSGEVGQWLLAVQSEAIFKILWDSRTRFSPFCTPRSLGAEAVYTPSAGSAKSSEMQKGENASLQEGTAAKMLDYGGAHGQLIEVASRLNLDLSILASHEDAFTSLSQRREAGANYKSITAGLLSTGLPDQSFEIVTSVRPVSHVDEWQKLISEICRISSDLVVIDYPPLVSSNILYRLLFPLKRILEGNTRTFTIFTHQQINSVFRANGFELEKRIGQFFWPMVLHRKLNSVIISKFLESIVALLGLVSFSGTLVSQYLDASKSISSIARKLKHIMNKLVLTFTLIGASFLICFKPAPASAQAIRAAIIGATSSMYRAEMRAIRRAIHYPNVTPKQNFMKSRKFTARLSNKNSEIRQQKPLNFDDIPGLTRDLAPAPVGNLISSEIELNKAGLEKF